MLTTLKKPETHEDSMAWAFPMIDPEHVVLGHRILLQVRCPRMISKGGIMVPEETRKTEQDNTQVAKVLDVGPVAYKNRTTLDPWPEGPWCAVGDFIRIPRYGGDRWNKTIPGREDPIEFVILRDHDIVAKVTGNPLEVRAFI